MKMAAIFITCLVLTSACSKEKELENKIDKLEKQAKDIQDTAEKKEELTATTNSENNREEKFRILLEDEAGFGERTTAAESLYKSFGKTSLVDAVTDFTRKLSDLYVRINPKKLKPGTDKKLEQSFYALAISVHVNESYNDLVARSKNDNSESMYKIISSALLKEKQGKKLKQHEEVILSGENREMSIELLKARVDMMSAIALKNLTDKKEMNLRQKAKAFIFRITGGKLGSIDLPEVYDKSNESTKIYTERYLDSAMRTRELLSEIGVSKPLEKSLRSAFKNIDFNESTGNEKAAEDNYKNMIRNHINGLIK